MNTKRSGSAHYITNNSQYGQGWHVHEGQLAVGMQKAQVPTYAEVVKNMQVIHLSIMQQKRISEEQKNL